MLKPLFGTVYVLSLLVYDLQDGEIQSQYTVVESFFRWIR